jgi:hypothetical protein
MVERKRECEKITAYWRDNRRSPSGMTTKNAEADFSAEQRTMIPCAAQLEMALVQ